MVSATLPRSISGVAATTPSACVYSNSSTGALDYLQMDGLGTQTLTGANTFTGAITVNAGTLVVDCQPGRLGRWWKHRNPWAGGTYDFRTSVNGQPVVNETLGNVNHGCRRQHLGSRQQWQCERSHADLGHYKHGHWRVRLTSDLNANGGATPVITSTSNLSAGTGGAYKWYVVTNGSGTFWATERSGAGTRHHCSNR